MKSPAVWTVPFSEPSKRGGGQEVSIAFGETQNPLVRRVNLLIGGNT